MAEPILTSIIFTNYVLPFLLIFTLIFAILDRTKILGEGKKQINAIIALVIGLFLIAFPYARDIVVKLMPVLAVVAVIILVFMILFGWVASGKEGFTMNKGLKITFGIIIALILIVAILMITGVWPTLTSMLTGENASAIWTNVLFIAIVIGVIAVVLATGKGKEEKSA